MGGLDGCPLREGPNESKKWAQTINPLKGPLILRPHTLKTYKPFKPTLNSSTLNPLDPWETLKPLKSRFLVLPFRQTESSAPKNHINIRILQTMTSGIHRYIGPWNQNVRSLCLYYLMPYYTKYHTMIM